MEVDAASIEHVAWSMVCRGDGKVLPLSGCDNLEYTDSLELWKQAQRLVAWDPRTWKWRRTHGYRAGAGRLFSRLAFDDHGFAASVIMTIIGRVAIDMSFAYLPLP